MSTLTLARGLTLSSKIATNSAFLATAGCGTSYSRSIDLFHQRSSNMDTVSLPEHTATEESGTISISSDSLSRAETYSERV